MPSESHRLAISHWELSHVPRNGFNSGTFGSGERQQLFTCDTLIQLISYGVVPRKVLFSTLLT